jgi:aldehyde dehydrogenase (NAD+)
MTKKVAKKTAVKTNKKAAVKVSVKSSKKEIKAFTPYNLFSYDPAPESNFVKLKKRYELFIDGKWQAPQSGKYFKTISPATEEVLAEVAHGNQEDINLAVKSAKVAMTKWSKLSGADRGKYLFRIARILQERAREFAILESLDGGKPIKESRDVDIPLAAAHFFYYAGWADKLEYLVPGKKEVHPIGVCGQIIPWNFPLLMAAWKIAPALAAGCTTVLKPAETTPLTALLLAEVFQEAELPPGVVNIVTGFGDTGECLVKHPDIAKIAFTGSTDIGKRIASNLAGTDKKLTLELGGKSAHIIFEDAAIDQSVEGIINGIFFNQGHVCCAGSRLLVEESVAQTILKKLDRRMNSLRVGNPLDKNTDIGAINSKEQLQKIEALVAQGKKEGGEFFESSCSLPKKGFFHRPCYFAKTSGAHTINRVEVFGPVLSIQTFRTPDEAIMKANDTAYGLAAGIWSEKGSKIHYVAARLKAGVIWNNTYNKFDPASPFGGYQESGIGREGGRQGLLAYLKF